MSGTTGHPLDISPLSFFASDREQGELIIFFSITFFFFCLQVFNMFIVIFLYLEGTKCVFTL